MIHIAFIFFSLITAVVIILLYQSERNKKFLPQKNARSEFKGKKNSVFKRCIICDSPLSKNEKQISKEIKRKDDSIIHIEGCIHCLSDGPVKRVCPVCKREIGKKEYMIGRMWLREKTNKMHLHVAGCTRCAKIKLNR